MNRAMKCICVNDSDVCDYCNGGSKMSGKVLSKVDVRGIAGAWINLHGRQVFKHKIDRTDYMPISDYDCEQGIDRTWYLMIERDGKTWIWDGMIEEG